MRVAYANVRAGVLCLGDPGGRHVRVRTDGLQVVGRVAGAPPDDDLDDDDLDDDDLDEADLDSAGRPGEAEVLAWGDLLALEADAPSTRWRYPGVLSTVIAAVVGTIGIDGPTDGAELDVEITTGEGVEVVRCDGFAGSGYWSPHLQAVQVLLRLLVGDRSTRQWLDAPAEMLGVLASIARGGPTDEALADELRVALSPGPSARRGSRPDETSRDGSGREGTDRDGTDSDGTDSKTESDGNDSEGSGGEGAGTGR